MYRLTLPDTNSKPELGSAVTGSLSCFYEPTFVLFVTIPSYRRTLSPGGSLLSGDWAVFLASSTVREALGREPLAGRSLTGFITLFEASDTQMI